MMLPLKEFLLVKEGIATEMIRCSLRLKNFKD